MLFGVSLVKKGVISPLDFVHAVERSYQRRLPIGQLALKAGKLNMHQVFEILAAQTESQKPFGRIAIELGYLTELELAELLMMQTDSAPRFSQILLEFGAITPETLAHELAEHYSSASERNSAPRTDSLRPSHCGQPG
jgi:hypothetical protein